MCCEVNTFTCECNPGYKEPLCAKDIHVFEALVAVIIKVGYYNIIIVDEGSIIVIFVLSGTAGVLLLIILLLLSVVCTLMCAPKFCSKVVSKSDDSG